MTRARLDVVGGRATGTASLSRARVVARRRSRSRAQGSPARPLPRERLAAEGFFSSMVKVG